MAVGRAVKSCRRHGWWILPGRTSPLAGGRLFLVPALHLEVVMTAGAYNDADIAVKEADIFNRVVAAVQP
jgi:hypothetical protein